MEVIVARGVNEAYYHGYNLLMNVGRRQPSRAGDVLVAPTPVTTVYTHPQERVLFDPVRDANPFFHLFESIWMLAGRNDGAWLDQFVSDFSKRFGEGDGTIHGAYGHRWRAAFGFDQLDAVVDKLSNNRDNRQAVIQMWDCLPDTRYLTNGGEANCGSADLWGNWKDRPCNLLVLLRVRRRNDVGVDPDDYRQFGIDVNNVNPDGSDYRIMAAYDTESVLDITVPNRSNDIIWGAYGSNAVHFSILQEYLAARLGVGIGRYYQVSNNFHGYVDVCRKIAVPFACATYKTYDIRPKPMFSAPAAIDVDVRHFMHWTRNFEYGQAPGQYSNTWFTNTAEPLFVAYERWRAKERELALDIVQNLMFDMAPDWRLAAQLWMQRRMERMVVKEGVSSHG